MKATFTTTLALLLATATATLAQKPLDQPHSPSRLARTEVKAYVEQNVLPVVRQQRQKLESQLAGADKAQLATYRTQLKDVRQRSQALRHSFRANRANAPKATESTAGNPLSLTDEQRQQTRQLHTETRAILQGVRELAQKYERNIAQLTQEVQSQRDKWATDLGAIEIKKLGAEQPAVGVGGRVQDRMPRYARSGKYFRPTQFLLMEPGTSAVPEAGVGATSLYPNPVVATSQLEYTVTKAGPVTVELLDGRGNTLRTIAQEPKQEKGTHTLPISLNDLKSGTYYYKITTRTGSETKRFVKE